MVNHAMLDYDGRIACDDTVLPRGMTSSSNLHYQGCDRLPRAAARHGLCGRCGAGVVADQATEGVYV
jgi:hypothetical protein